jgi:hypothetical protein
MNRNNPWLFIAETILTENRFALISTIGVLPRGAYSILVTLT